MLKPSLTSYGCSSSAGPTSEDFWSRLVRSERDHQAHSLHWPQRGESALETIHLHLQLALDEAISRRLEKPFGSLGVIFASAKGIVEDHIWKDESLLEEDLIHSVLEHFLQSKKHPFSEKVLRSVSISDACASAHAAFFLANRWLQGGVVQEVLVLTADVVGPFIESGFQKLDALTTTTCRPFGKGRDGLRLGEAATALFFSAGPGPWVLEGVGLDTEGAFVTRPSGDGASLKRAFFQAGLEGVDLAVAHGTGTSVNDRIEDQVLVETLGVKVPVFGTKTGIGHTMGSSGAMDVIAAAESLRQGLAPGWISYDLDETLRSDFLKKPVQKPFKKALVSSLGFGGVHAALTLSRTEVDREWTYEE